MYLQSVYPDHNIRTVELNVNWCFEPCTMLRQLLTCSIATDCFHGHQRPLRTLPGAWSSLTPSFFSSNLAVSYCPIVHTQPARTPTSYDATLQLSFHSPVDHVSIPGIYRHSSRTRSHSGGQRPLLGVHRPCCNRDRHPRVGGREAAGLLPIRIDGADNVVAYVRIAAPLVGMNPI